MVVGGAPFLREEPLQVGQEFAHAVKRIHRSRQGLRSAKMIFKCADHVHAFAANQRNPADARLHLIERHASEGSQFAHRPINC